MVARSTVSTRTTLPLTPSSTISTNLAIAPSSKAERFQGAYRNTIPSTLETLGLRNRRRGLVRAVSTARCKTGVFS